MEWRNPSVEITKHIYIVAVFLYLYDDCEDEEVSDMDIFSYDGINGYFVSKSGSRKIKYDKIVKWIPVPRPYE